MKYEQNYEISCHDVDVNNNIRPSLVLRYMQDAGNHHMRDRKPSYYDLFFAGKSFVLTRITVEIYEQLHQYDKIDVSTWRCLEKGATFRRCFEMKREGQLVAKAYSEWAVTNRTTGKLYKASEIDITNYDTDEVVELCIPTRFHLPKDKDYELVGHKHVYYSDVDMNRHMNNTNYPDMIWNFIPDVMEKEVTSINLRFMHEALLDTDLDVFMVEEDAAFSKDPRAEEAWCFRTRDGDDINIEAVIGTRGLERQRGI